MSEKENNESNIKYGKLFAQADLAFNGLYKKQLAELKGFTQDEKNKIIPNAEADQVYVKLIELVENASKENLSKAKLIENINNLGEVAVGIAKKVPSLAMIL